jgi:ComEC/Rec2-related protein
MWKSISSLTILFLFIDSLVLKQVARWSLNFHHFCLDFSPAHSAHRELYSAMVCGSTPPPTEFMSDLRVIGLYHLIVVSGSHFIFLETLLQWLARRLGRFGDAVVFFLLTLFALVCLLAPPVVRAWLSFSLRKTNDELKLGWQGQHLAFFSGVVTLFIFPEWIQSLSFMLSWGASLLIALPVHESWRRHLLIYAGLIPLLYGLQPQNPATSLVNWLLAPVLGLWMLPACLVAFFLPPLTPVIDWLWSIFLFVTKIIAQQIPTDVAVYSFSFLWGWVYLFAGHILIFYVLRARARGT